MHIVFVRALTWVWSRATPKGHTVSGGITTPALVVVVTLMHTVGGDRGQTCRRGGGVRARVHARARACVGVCCARAGACDNVGLSSR